MKEKRGLSLIYAIAIVSLTILLLPPVRGWFHMRGGVRWLHILLLSMLSSFLVTPLVKRLAFRFNILDIPDARKVHTNPTPLMGGIGIYLSFLLSILSNAIFTKGLIAIVVGGTLVFIISLLDDTRGVSAHIRLLVQFLATTILILSGVSIVIFPQVGHGFVANALITYLWVIGITNSVNFFDGMDGLATGLSIIIALFLGVVAFQTNQPFLGWLSVAILGGCLGFLPYNFGPRRPAEIFLGDCGGTFLGFTLASLAVMGEWSERSMLASLATPLLIFSILIYDMVYITINRFATGKVHNLQEWIDYVGKDHLHHRMEALLMSRRKAVLFIYLLAFTLGINALVLRDVDTIHAFLLIAQAVLILTVVSILEIVGNRRERRREVVQG